MKKIDIKISKKSILLYMLTFFIIVLGDQVTKIIVDQSFKLGSGITIIDRFFYFTYIHNTGAAWGMFAGNIAMFLVISLIAGVAIGYYFIKSNENQLWVRFGLILVFSGMIGNVIDRLMFGYVRDFIDFIIFGYDFPIFNIADMAVVIGVALIILELGVEEYNAWKLSKSI